MTLRPTLLASSLLLAAAAAVPARAAESYDNCVGEITTLPATLSSQGVWCLKQDLSTGIASGDAITVAANNVTIDCNGFKIGGLQAGPETETRGIVIQDRMNAVVRGCNVRGFQTGVLAEGGGGHVVEDNRVVASVSTGIRVGAAHSVVRRNEVMDTGGSPMDGTHALGIVALEGVDVLDNTVAGVAASVGGFSVGIATVINTGATIRGNRISGLMRPAGGEAQGISSSLGNPVIEGNAIVGLYMTGSTGILCDSAAGTSVRNTIVGFTTGVNGCHSTGDVFNPN